MHRNKGYIKPTKISFWFCLGLMSWSWSWSGAMSQFFWADCSWLLTVGGTRVLVGQPSCLCFPAADFSDAVSGMYWALNPCQCSVADYCLWHLHTVHWLHATQLCSTLLVCAVSLYCFWHNAICIAFTSHTLSCYCTSSHFTEFPCTLPIIGCDTCNHRSDRCFRQVSLTVFQLSSTSSLRFLTRSF